MARLDEEFLPFRAFGTSLTPYLAEKVKKR